MSNEPTIVDFRSRKAPEAVELDTKRLEEIEAQLKKNEEAETKSCFTSAAEDFAQFVTGQEIDGAIIIARHKVNGHFYHDMAFGPAGCSPETALAWIGMLEILKAEMVDIAMMSSSLAPNGDILSPDIQHVTIMEEAP